MQQQSAQEQILALEKDPGAVGTCWSVLASPRPRRPLVFHRALPRRSSLRCSLLVAAALRAACAMFRMAALCAPLWERLCFRLLLRLVQLAISAPLQCGALFSWPPLCAQPALFLEPRLHVRLFPASVSLVPPSQASSASFVSVSVPLQCVALLLVAAALRAARSTFL